MKSDILGVRFDGVTLSQAVDRVLDLAAAGRGGYVCTPNPEIVWASRKDAALRAALAGADLTLPDGTGVVWASRVLGAPLPERVAGYDLLLALLERAPGRVYYLGGKPGVAERAAKAAEARYGARTAGCRDGYFDDPAPVLAEITAAAPDLALVCLGSPRQERFMAWAKAQGAAFLMLGLGGSLDVLSGDKPRAPERWRDAGLEWLYRLLRDPRRIGRQMRLPLFAGAVLAERIKKRGSEEPPSAD